MRERRGLAYSVYSYAGHYADAGIFCVGAGCLPGKLDQVLDVVRAELRLLAEYGLTAEELERGKGQLRGGLVLGLEDSAARMSRIAKSELHGEELPSIEEIIRRVDAVTLADVHDLARTLFSAAGDPRRRRPGAAEVAREEALTPAPRHRTGTGPRREPGRPAVRPTRMRPTLRRPRATPVRASTLSALALVAALTGCGSRPSVRARAASATSGPELQVAADARDEVDCDGGPDRTGAGDYVDGGLETVQDDPAAAVQNLLAENYVGAPDADYVVVARNQSRALVTYEVDREAKVAFVVEDGITDWDGNVGWGVTSYAACDLAEMPPEISDAAGIGVWTDADGDAGAHLRDPVLRRAGALRLAGHHLPRSSGDCRREPAVPPRRRRCAGPLHAHVVRRAGAAARRRDRLGVAARRACAVAGARPQRGVPRRPRRPRGCDVAERWPGAKEPIGCM